MGIINWLKGKKTYFLSGAAILGAIGAYLGGELQAMEAIYTILGALGFTALRDGMKTESKKIKGE